MSLSRAKASEVSIWQTGLPKLLIDQRTDVKKKKRCHVKKRSCRIPLIISKFGYLDALRFSASLRESSAKLSRDFYGEMLEILQGKHSEHPKQWRKLQFFNSDI